MNNIFEFSTLRVLANGKDKQEPPKVIEIEKVVEKIVEKPVYKYIKR